MNDFFKKISEEGIPVDVKIDIPDKTLLLLGLVLLVAIFLSQVLATYVTWKIRG